MTAYDTFNREERAMCAHFFRLLHEGLDKRQHSPVARFLCRLGVTPKNFDHVAIYAEAAMIRDVYLSRKILSSESRIDSIVPLTDEMVMLIAQMEGTLECVPYSQLPRPLNVPTSTHPRQIYDKIISKAKLTPPRTFTQNEKRVYKTLKDVFLARPDIAITVDTSLIIVEASLSMPVPRVRVALMSKVAQIWAVLLCPYLGFEQPPQWSVYSLSRFFQGASENMSDITWVDVYQIAKETYPPSDRTVVALKAVCVWIEKIGIKRATRTRQA